MDFSKLVFLPQNDEERNYKLAMDCLKGVPSLYCLQVGVKMLEVCERQNTADEIQEIINNGIELCAFDNRQHAAEEENWFAKKHWGINDSDSALDWSDKVGAELGRMFRYSQDRTCNFLIHMIGELVMKVHVAVEIMAKLQA